MQHNKKLHNGIKYVMYACLYNGYSSVIVCFALFAMRLLLLLIIHFSGMGLSVAMSTLVLAGTKAVSSSGKSGMGSRQ